MGASCNVPWPGFSDQDKCKVIPGKRGNKDALPRLPKACATQKEDAAPPAAFGAKQTTQNTSVHAEPSELEMRENVPTELKFLQRVKPNIRRRHP